MEGDLKCHHRRQGTLVAQVSAESPILAGMVKRAKVMPPAACKNTTGEAPLRARKRTKAEASPEFLLQNLNMG